MTPYEYEARIKELEATLADVRKIAVEIEESILARESITKMWVHAYREAFLELYGKAQLEDAIPAIEKLNKALKYVTMQCKEHSVGMEN